jgi:hypothetical protein
MCFIVTSKITESFENWSVGRIHTHVVVRGALAFGTLRHKFETKIGRSHNDRRNHSRCKKGQK